MAVTDADLLARDAAHRERALDVTRSFLVQAPAGSGKTELLTQRYLALLARVDRPEAIVAMTFTRKAAAEMRERIGRALDAAAGASPCAPHEQRTRELALAVLVRDRAQGWELRAHPARLRITTIDALCATLARQAPLATKLGAFPQLEERPDALYRDAVREALAAAPPEDPRWKDVLAHLDNDGARAVEVLAQLLQRRDQWLTRLVGHDAAELRADLEAVLREEIEHALAEARDLVPPGIAAALAPLAGFAADHLPAAADPGRVEAWRDLAARRDLPPATADALAAWQALADFLLVKDKASLRSSLTKNQGFPAADKTDPRRAEAKSAMEALLAELRAIPELAEKLHLARRLPPPRYADDAWRFVDALLALLPRLAAQLRVSFAAARRIDFPEAALQAREALGSDDAPSDLLLRIDYALSHLLVDEFQDTSDLQLDLIARLTAGWVAGDGRTLFAVGDPMQSIYRFREAEVRLFLDGVTTGRVAGLPVQFLDLARNFRSQANVVDWVNRVFPTVFPARVDPWNGAVGYAAAVAARPAEPGVVPTLDLVADVDAEADRVVERVRAALDAGARSVAILVRARTHLGSILPALRAADIAFAAVELETLGERQSIRDLLALTQALSQPADRLSWLALLRAPWCGLVLPDLVAFDGEAQRLSGGWCAALAQPAAIAGVSPDGRARLARVATVLLPSLAARGADTLAERVRAAWLALGGPACVDDALDLSAVERFLAELARHESAGEIADYDAFVDAIGRLNAVADDAAAARVQVMTLHKAKGLQFDAVVLPGLGRKVQAPDAPLLRWRLRPGGLLLAPQRARAADTDPVYDFLAAIERREESAELSRLLYVGCTRAIARLHLTAVLPTVRTKKTHEVAWRDPPGRSALAKLWTALAREAGDPPPPPEATVADAEPAGAPRLLRLPLDWRPPAPAAAVPLERARAVVVTPEYVWAAATAAAVGTVAHRVFAQIAREGLADWDVERVGSLGARLAAELADEGVGAAERDAATGAVIEAVVGVLDTPRGRWLFDPAHAEAASERPLAGVDDDAVVHVTLDRSFVADGVRWIIDFKTGTHEGGDPAAFLDREVTRHRDQLERYARILRALDGRPIRLGLFYPRIADGWREWAAAG